jgi:hypothetical protein
MTARREDKCEAAMTRYAIEGQTVKMAHEHESED